MSDSDFYIHLDDFKKLEKDGQLFELFKDDGLSINLNDLLNKVIAGYYDVFVEEKNRSIKIIREKLDAVSDTAKDKSLLSQEIYAALMTQNNIHHSGGNNKRIYFKPNKDNTTRMGKIRQDAGERNSFSEYMRTIIKSYLDKPITIREQIVFNENYKKIIDACRKGISISFYTIWDSKNLHIVLPYKIVTGQEEMLNYLLCSEINQNNGKAEAKAYRLNRIEQVNNDGSMAQTIDGEIKSYLDKMIQYGAAYAINDDIETCVRLTDSGVKNYQRIYWGRPQRLQDKDEKKDGYTYYYFNCSETQLFLYFKRFKGADAQVVYPSELKERIIEFHERSFEAYKANEEIENG